jgi:hypothetical protein
MSKVIIVFVLVLSGFPKAYAQQPADEKKEINIRTLSLAVSPLSLLEIEPTVNLQVMYIFSSKHAAAIEVGRIIKPFRDDEDDEYSPLHSFAGWRFRPEFRFISSSKLNRKRNFYMAIQGLVKFAEEQSFYFAQRTTPSGFFYREALRRTVNKTVTGSSFIVGEDMNLLKPKKLGLDFYTGVGIRYKHLKDNIGSDFNSPTDYGFNSNKNGFYPTVALGLRMRLKIN